ncbi:MAG: hypothetical protein K8R53_03625, partial [Bacteroidales bacterium]|nr:hypothetical protein [Bacteroidales bacterium]
VPRFTDLLLVVVLMMNGNERYFLSINRHGDVAIYSTDDLRVFAMELGNDIKIVLPLASFFLKFLIDYDNLAFLEETSIINRMEAELLTRIHNGDYEEINIKFRDKKIKQINLKNEIKATSYKTLIEIISQKKYQNITIKTENGSIAYAVKVSKIAIK